MPVACDTQEARVDDLLAELHGHQRSTRMALMQDQGLRSALPLQSVFVCVCVHACLCYGQLVFRVRPAVALRVLRL